MRSQIWFIFVRRRNQWRVDNFFLSPILSVTVENLMAVLSDLYARLVRIRSCSRFRARIASSGSYSSGILHISANTPCLRPLLHLLFLVSPRVNFICCNSAIFTIYFVWNVLLVTFIIVLFKEIIDFYKTNSTFITSLLLYFSFFFNLLIFCCKWISLISAPTKKRFRDSSRRR